MNDKYHKFRERLQTIWEIFLYVLQEILWKFSTGNIQIIKQTPSVQRYFSIQGLMFLTMIFGVVGCVIFVRIKYGNEGWFSTLFWGILVGLYTYVCANSIASIDKIKAEQLSANGKFGGVILILFFITFVSKK